MNGMDSELGDLHLFGGLVDRTTDEGLTLDGLERFETEKEKELLSEVNESDIFKLMIEAVNNKASDLHIRVGSRPMLRISGDLRPLPNTSALTEETVFQMIEFLLSDTAHLETLSEFGEVDFVYQMQGLARFRGNAYRERNNHAMVLRVISDKLLSFEKLGLPKEVQDFARKKRGLVLVTGPTGSGKSTTLASLIDYINEHTSDNIITIEDPIEYVHHTKKSVISQREIGSDTKSFENALRAALRQDPDVILIGEMRDAETISIALTAAETAHLVFSTLHTVGAAKTIDRIIDVFPNERQQQIRIQLSTVLQGIVSQQLIPKVDGGRIAAIELMFATPAIANNIREGKTYQIQSMIQTGMKHGMRTMDMSLADLARNNVISNAHAISFASDPDALSKML